MCFGAEHCEHALRYFVGNFDQFCLLRSQLAQLKKWDKGYKVIWVENVFMITTNILW